MGETGRTTIAKWLGDLIVSAILVPTILALLQINPWVIAIISGCCLVLLLAWEHQYKIVT